MKSSARNQLAGTVTHIEHSNGSCLVTLSSAGGIEIHAQISSFSLKRLKLSVGSPVIAMIKAASVVLATDPRTHDFIGRKLPARHSKTCGTRIGKQCRYA